MRWLSTLAQRRDVYSVNIVSHSLWTDAREVGKLFTRWEFSAYNKLLMNTINPGCDVATVCHQVRCMCWGHQCLFSKGRYFFFNCSNLVQCLRDLLCKLIGIMHTKMFAMYLQIGVLMCCLLTHWGRDNVAAIFQTTFSNTFFWMKMHEFRLKFHWNLFPRVQSTKFQHWFIYWLGAGQATSHYLSQWWIVYRRIYASLGLNELRDMAV